MNGQNTNQESNNHHSSFINPPSSLASSGAACRMQIRQGTGVEAIHPILLVADFLKETLHAKE
jgi:Fe-S oxidoreductase